MQVWLVMWCDDRNNLVCIIKMNNKIYLALHIFRKLYWILYFADVLPVLLKVCFGEVIDYDKQLAFWTTKGVSCVLFVSILLLIKVGEPITVDYPKFEHKPYFEYM